MATIPRRVCPVCKGYGRLTTPPVTNQQLSNPRVRKALRQAVACDACDGTGWLPAKAPTGQTK